MLSGDLSLQPEKRVGKRFYKEEKVGKKALVCLTMLEFPGPSFLATGMGKEGRQTASIYLPLPGKQAPFISELANSTCLCGTVVDIRLISWANTVTVMMVMTVLKVSAGLEVLYSKRFTCVAPNCSPLTITWRISVVMSDTFQVRNMSHKNVESFAYPVYVRTGIQSQVWAFNTG